MKETGSADLVDVVTQELGEDLRVEGLVVVDGHVGLLL